MAHSKWHIVSMVSVAPLVAFYDHRPLAIGVALACGVLIDFDHLLQWERTKEVIKTAIRNKSFAIKKYWDKVEDMAKPPNWGHTWVAFLLVFFLCKFLVRSWLPLASYSIHMVVDGFDDGYFRHKGVRIFIEMPYLLARCLPRSWRYNKNSC